jgi:hypothetical protein
MMRYELTDFEWAAIVDPRVPHGVQRPGGRLTAHNAHTNVASAGANAPAATGHEGLVRFPLRAGLFFFRLYRQPRRHPEERALARVSKDRQQARTSILRGSPKRARTSG